MRWVQCIGEFRVLGLWLVFENTRLQLLKCTVTSYQTRYSHGLQLWLQRCYFVAQAVCYELNISCRHLRCMMFFAAFRRASTGTRNSCPIRQNHLDLVMPREQFGVHFNQADSQLMSVQQANVHYNYDPSTTTLRRLALVVH